MERNDRLIQKKILKYMVTGVMTTIALQLGNVVDAMIVGNLLGSMGNAAVSASIPYIYMLQAATILLASGGSVMAAVLLGKRDAESAGKIMGFCLLAGIAYPLVFTFASPVLVPRYVQFTGAQGVLGEMTGDYSFIYSLGMPVISVALILSYFMNVDNHPSFSAGINILANVVNLVLDFILIRFTQMGIRGAALSTILGYLVAGLVYIPLYLRSKNRMLRPELKGLTATGALIREALKRGLPNLFYLILTVIGMSFLNRSILGALGVAYYSAFAVANNTQYIVQMFLNGISSVTASVAGALYGEKDYYGMRVVLKKVFQYALGAGAVLMAVFLLYPQGITRLYGFDEPEVIAELLTGLRLFALSFGFFICNTISQNYYRTTGLTFLATASTAMQLLVIKIPVMLLGMKLYGFAGLFASMILSELLSFLLLNLIRIFLQKRGKVPLKGFMAIPEVNSGTVCDLTVTGSDEQAVRVSQRIMEYCLNEKISARNANILGLATEEIVANIGQYGYPDRKDKNVDICLSGADGRYCLRIRDDGIPFDPVSYVPEEDSPETTGGLSLLKKMAVKITYMRVISLNNTIIEVENREGEAEHE